jgi:glycosyltransferase involved in cell wall biosynthesis
MGVAHLHRGGDGIGEEQQKLVSENQKKTGSTMKLLIAIPALNEEESIDSIIQRSIEAREFICANSPATEVAITVVSDGSTDRTVERASRYTDNINLIVFPQNKGYGAAIKEAWRQSDADLLGFLDADGTCEPKFFATLCKTAVAENADVVLGCRLNAASRMPLIRRVGNFIFATILSVFSSSRVRDTASGMRVVRRSSLDRLYPLPDGLHFTPAMSARAMLSEATSILEVDMPYHERAGESKLRVGKDGLRFLKVIMETAFLYRPSRPLGLLALVFLVFAALLMTPPLIYYVRNRSVAEWMIYRFLVSDLAGITACLCLCASYLTGRMASIALADESGGGTRRWSARLFQAPWFWIVPIGFCLAGGSLVIKSLFDRITTGMTYEHWSRYVVMSFCFAVAIILSVTRIIDYVLNLVGSRLDYLKAHSFEMSLAQSRTRILRGAGSRA